MRTIIVHGLYEWRGRKLVTGISPKLATSLCLYPRQLRPASTHNNFVSPFYRWSHSISSPMSTHHFIGFVLSQRFRPRQEHIFWISSQQITIKKLFNILSPMSVNVRKPLHLSSCSTRNRSWSGDGTTMLELAFSMSTNLRLCNICKTKER